MPYMYILGCSDGSLYTGSTWNLLLRLEQHQSGKGAIYTSRRQPVRLLYFEEFERVADAYAREKQVQGWNRLRKDQLIENGFGVKVTTDSPLLGD